MNTAFVIPSRFHAPRSVLGRWIGSAVEDPRRAESLYMVVVSLAAVVLVLSQFLAWSALQPVSAAGLRIFAVVEAAAAALFVLTCLFGRQRKIVVRVDDRGLRVEREGETEVVPFAAVEGVSTIDAAAYYTHYARYRATRSFVNTIHPQLLLVTTASRPLVLGVEPSDLSVLRRMLDERSASAYSASHAGAA